MSHSREWQDSRLRRKHLNSFGVLILEGEQILTKINFETIPRHSKDGGTRRSMTVSQSHPELRNVPLLTNTNSVMYTDRNLTKNR